MNIYKKCRRCKLILTLENSTYYRLRNHIYLCNDCDREEKRIWAANKYKKDPEVAAAKSLIWSQNNAIVHPINHKCAHMYSGSRRRATIMHLDFNISTSYLMSIAPSECPVLKFKLNYFSKFKYKDSPSIDRINPEKGYIIGNVQIISYLANLMKSSANGSELLLFADWVIKTYSGE